jgi:ribonuclease HI
MEIKESILIYTDGSCPENPGKGGYGYIINLPTETHEGYQGFELTTNNRMELMAVVEALKELRNSEVWEEETITLYSDSKYVLDPINKGWLKRWKKNNFKGKMNVDLWKEFLEVYRALPVKPIFKWVKGHSGVEGNERADHLAYLGSSGDRGYLVDKGYILTSKN